jgi:hypothetical protein
LGSFLGFFFFCNFIIHGLFSFKFDLYSFYCYLFFNPLFRVLEILD